MPRKAKLITAPRVLQIVGGNPLGPNAPYLPNSVINTGPVIDPLSAALIGWSTNPYLIGIFYIFLNLGGRFLALELTKKQEWFLAQPYVRPIILFAVLFIATRNLAVAFWAATIILSVLWLFANENSKFCLIPGWRVDDTKIEQDKNYKDAMKKIQEKKLDHSTHEPDHHEEPVHQEEPQHNESAKNEPTEPQVENVEHNTDHNVEHK